MLVVIHGVRPLFSPLFFFQSAKLHHNLDNGERGSEVSMLQFNLISMYPNRRPRRMPRTEYVCTMPTLHQTWWGKNTTCLDHEAWAEITRPTHTHPE